MMEHIHGGVGSPAVSLLDISRKLLMLKGLMWHGFPVAKRISKHRQKLHVAALYDKPLVKILYQCLCSNLRPVSPFNLHVTLSNPNQTDAGKVP